MYVIDWNKDSRTLTVLFNGTTMQDAMDAIRAGTQYATLNGITAYILVSKRNVLRSGILKL